MQWFDLQFCKKKPFGTWQFGKVGFLVNFINQESKFYKIAHLFCLNLRERENLFSRNLGLTSDNRFDLPEKYNVFYKGSLISEGPIANIRCQISPLSRKFEFPSLYTKTTVERFGTCFWQWKKVKILSEIKPPLELTYSNIFKGPILHPNLRGG